MNEQSGEDEVFSIFCRDFSLFYVSYSPEGVLTFHFGICVRPEGPQMGA